MPPPYIIRSSERRAQHIVDSSAQHSSFQLGTLERPIRDPKTFGFGTFVEAPCVVTRNSFVVSLRIPQPTGGLLFRHELRQIGDRRSLRQ
jgi:hypothetical protein